MFENFVYKSKKVVDGVKLTPKRLFEMIDGWDFEDDDGDIKYTLSEMDDTIECFVSGKKVPLNKVVFVLRNPDGFDEEQ